MKIINKVRINGEVILVDDLSKEEKERIGKELNKRALEAIGYKKDDDSVA